MIHHSEQQVIATQILQSSLIGSNSTVTDREGNEYRVEDGVYAYTQPGQLDGVLSFTISTEGRPAIAVTVLVSTEGLLA